MKRMKKFLAMFLAMAMVLGMSMTTFAAGEEENIPKSSVTVKGLVTKEGTTTTVKLYKMVGLGTVTDNTTKVTQTKWVVEDWAKDFVILSADGDSYTFDRNGGQAANESDPDKILRDALPESSTYDGSSTTDFVQIDNVGVGAYAVEIAGSDELTYSIMVANTFNDPRKPETGVVGIAKNITIYAKSDKYVTTKSPDKHVAGRGETVTFTIETKFPSFEKEQEGQSYKIVDEPTGLVLAKTATVKIGNGDDQTVDLTELEGKYTIDLSNQIGTGENFNQNAAKSVTVTYTAVVTADDGYENTAHAWKDNTDLGKAKDPDPVDPDPEDPTPIPKGYSGEITVTKLEAGDETKTALKGAKFQVVKVNDDGTFGDALLFVKVEGKTDTYKLAITGENLPEGVTADVGAVNEVEATNGTVTIRGLGVGKYHFIETKAPDGYAIDDNKNSVVMEDVTITEADLKKSAEDLSTDKIEKRDNEKVLVYGDRTYMNTKLASLPSTGGIGTTIFTVGGCAIMIIAAGLYFASRRRAAK